MKNLHLSFIIIIVLACSNGCNRPPRTFSEAMSDKYQGDKAYFHVKVPPALLQIVLKDEEAGSLSGLLKDLNQVGIMSVGNRTEESKEILNSDIASWLSHFQYEDLMTIAQSGSKISFKLLEKNGQVQELMAIIADSESVMIISLYGKLDMKQVMNLTRELNPEVFRNMVKLR
jgi:hypothetical protein